MVSRDLVTQTLIEILGAELITKAATLDSCPNQLQITGNPEVRLIALGVSCSPEFIRKAITKKADYLICHHGLSVNSDVVNGRMDAIANRLKLIIKNNLSLAGFHYVLDAHPVLGNNAQLINRLKAHRTNETYFDSWGWVAEYDTPVLIDEIIDHLKLITSHSVYAVKFGPKKVKRLGVCSGGARPHGTEVMEIIDKKIDVHITGEISESGPYLAEEIGFNYLSCGHYATETFGVKALSQELIKRFGIEVAVEFIETNGEL